MAPTMVDRDINMLLMLPSTIILFLVEVLVIHRAFKLDVLMVSASVGMYVLVFRRFFGVVHG